MFSQWRAVYQRTRKAEDNFWNTYIARPLAAPLVAAWETRAISPNQVTLLSFWVAMLSLLPIVFWRSHAGLLCGILLLQASYVLDCVDGMLARARHMASPQGHLFDFLMDELKALALWAAVSARLYLQTQDSLYLLLGLVGLVGLSWGLSLTTFLRRPELQTEASRAHTDKKRGIIGLVEFIAKFLIHYPSYVVYIAIFDRVELYFFAYLAVTLLYAARTLLFVMLRMGRN